MQLYRSLELLQLCRLICASVCRTATVHRHIDTHTHRPFVMCAALLWNRRCFDLTDPTDNEPWCWVCRIFYLFPPYPSHTERLYMAPARPYVWCCVVVCEQHCPNEDCADPYPHPPRTRRLAIVACMQCELENMQATNVLATHSNQLRGKCLPVSPQHSQLSQHSIVGCRLFRLCAEICLPRAEKLKGFRVVAANMTAHETERIRGRPWAQWRHGYERHRCDRQPVQVMEEISVEAFLHVGHAFSTDTEHRTVRCKTGMWNVAVEGAPMVTLEKWIEIFCNRRAICGGKTDDVSAVECAKYQINASNERIRPRCCSWCSVPLAV